MDNIPHESILRYHPKDGSAHSTAVMVENTLLEVKREGQTVRNRYPSVDVWLLSFPGASWSEIVVSHPADARPTNARSEPEPEPEPEDNKVSDEKAQEQEQKTTKKTKKAEKAEKLKLHLIPSSRQIYSTMWTHHLHHLMKEANPALLKREDVIRAFNRLVDVLVEHQTHVYTISPNLSNRYEENTVIPDMSKTHKELSIVCHVEMNSVYRDPGTGRMVIHRRYYRPHAPIPTKEEFHISKQILDAYLPLLDLIRGDILPYMERMRAAAKNKYITREIQKLMERMDRAQANFERDLEYRKRALDAFVSRHETEMSRTRKLIADLVSTKSE